MFLFLGHFGHCIHEINRIGKIIEFKRAFDVFLLQFPFRDFLSRVFSSSAFIKSAITGQRVTPENRFATPKRADVFAAVIPSEAQRSQGIPQHCLKVSQRDSSTTLHLVPLGSE
jgi:hypothetical protein